ncbi:MAG: hypothetical protein LBQ58_05740 [Synergistaceae bacterium]|jgi:hypothetical protein|nr:hypothetical protein [Synergistaceae bacterium]
MADIQALSGKLVFKMDSGEVKDGKTVYRNLTLSGVNGDSPLGDLGMAAACVEGLLEFPVEQVSLTRVDVLSY